MIFPSGDYFKEDNLRLKEGTVHHSHHSYLLCLQERFMKNKIYTSTGGVILIVMNPFKNLPELYSKLATM